MGLNEAVIAVVGGILVYVAQRFKLLPVPSPDGNPVPVPAPLPVQPKPAPQPQPQPAACSPEHFLPWLLDLKAGKIAATDRDRQYLDIIKATLPQ